jgi:acetate---CoA ligase (ADP-forming)
VASHSGSLLGGLISRGKARNVGFAGLVSVGNEIDLSLGEICSATLDDPAVTSYMLFLESIRHGRELRRFALDAAARGKPIIAYKLGRSKAAAELALSHTGALAGEDEVAAAFLADCGIARVFNFETLLEALPLLQRLPARPAASRRVRVGVVTTTGGGAAMVVDELAMRGIDVVKPSDATYARLREAGVGANHERITDLTLAGTRYDVMKAALVRYGYRRDRLVRPLSAGACRQAGDRQRVVGKASGRVSGSRGATSAEHADCCGCAELPHAGILRRCRECCALAASAGRAFCAAAWGRLQADQAARRIRRYNLLDRLGVPHAAAVVVDVDAASISLPFAYPVAVKLLSAEIAHKTEVGGVVLNVGSEHELRPAMRTIVDNVKALHPELIVSQVLVQPMTSGLGEMLLGYRADHEAGPLVLLAAGGIYTEIYRDRSIRLAPVDRDTARSMIAELAISRVFQGFRNKPDGDMEALARAIVAISQLAVNGSIDVVDAEINPLIIKREGEGVVAVDALVALG